ncbi:MAG TPA: preprotein translocase subunit SecE [Fimbriimonadaceae bacterium]|nr:preprotein translocase subunit SecE [Fimbriimonadaceae bacterium]
MSKNQPSAPSTPTSIPLPKSRRGFKQYWVDVIREMKKVTWPPHSETNRLTGVVLAVCVLMIIMLSVFHLVFETIVSLLTKTS